MTEQLHLVDVPAVPRLSERQQTVLDALKTAGSDGLEASEAGALLHERRGIHDRDARCQWCGATGNEVMRALRTKKLVKYRRKIGAWVIAGGARDYTADPPAAPGSVPFNEFPEGF